MSAKELLAPLEGPPAFEAWPGRHRIGNFELQSIVTQSNAGLVYRAWDHALARPVAIKEYLPAALARRGASGEIEPSRPDSAELFERGRHAFIDEARTLGRCDHPSLVRVLDLIETRGTAYRVMPWYSGRVLFDVCRRMSGPLGEPALRLLLDNLIDALDAFGRIGGVHRSVGPLQVMLLDDGRSLLLGPRAAIRASQVDFVLAPSAETGFAPPEQTARAHGQPQGPWTDFYALAATARFCINGMLPPTDGVSVPETLTAAAERVSAGQPPRYDARLIQALEAALSPDISRRPQTAAQFREWLQPVQQARRIWPAASVETPPPSPPVVVAEAPAADGVTVAALDASARAESIDAEAFAPLLVLDSTLNQPGPGPAPLAPPAKPSRGARWAGLALAAAAAAGVGAWMLLAPPLGADDAALPDRVVSTTPAAPAAESKNAATQPVLMAGLPERPAKVDPALPEPARRTEHQALPASTRPEPAATVGAPAAKRPVAERAVAERAAADAAARTTTASPRQECGARTEFSLYRCMQQQCSLGKWQRHAQCLRLEETDSVD